MLLYRFSCINNLFVNGLLAEVCELRTSSHIDVMLKRLSYVTCMGTQARGSLMIGIVICIDICAHCTRRTALLNAHTASQQSQLKQQHKNYSGWSDAASDASIGYSNNTINNIHSSSSANDAARLESLRSDGKLEGHIWDSLKFGASKQQSSPSASVSMLQRLGSYTKVSNCSWQSDMQYRVMLSNC